MSGHIGWNSIEDPEEQRRLAEELGIDPEMLSLMPKSKDLNLITPSNRYSAANS